MSSDDVIDKSQPIFVLFHDEGLTYFNFLKTSQSVIRYPI